ncbi:ABC transporter substrate-binding protein [Roseomonas terrae]|jgi:peptide/nickel transport system substrate-binding protein|uniref:ABC transporter substrate-binding protein n=1 Tax=Neoroseomonas terrae TaxID=424799 RepID=A0ABS5EF64_9PROT|nr:ABC transporter substrate-binding protein [Neoroseomonas terrae]MBR0649595.1 ABC transporter substrate-binding protein [Neoroseomonas terrae]
MQRRHLIAGTGAALLGAMPRRPALGQGTAAAPRVLKFVPQAEPTVLDPIVTTATATRTHGYAVWDTLYGFNQDYAPEPQMAEGHTVDADGRRVSIRLREGLKFHDGEPVRAADCAASIRRWAARDPLGQVLLPRIEEMTATDDRTLVLRLSKPFPLLFHALAKPAAPVCFIMPERLAATDPSRAVTEIIGSGPFRYLPDEREAGRRLVYERFADYVPRADGVPSWTAGPKRAHMDRIEWHVRPDAAAASDALVAGDVDWWENPAGTLQAALRRDRNIVLEVPDPTGLMGIARFNHLHPPFDRAPIRRALLGAIDQGGFMAAVIGEDRSLWRDDVGIFPPDTPFASDEALEALTAARDIDKVKREIAEAGYGGEKVVLLAATDFPTLAALASTGADTLRRVGLEVELVTGPWAELMRRRANRAAPAEGGWSMFFTTWNGIDMLSPASNQALRGTGADAWFGWPTMPRMEELRGQWFDAPDLAAQQAVARQIQAEAMREAPYLPLGQYFQATAYRRGISGMLKGLPVFWNVNKG